MFPTGSPPLHPGMRLRLQARPPSLRALSTLASLVLHLLLLPQTHVHASPTPQNITVDDTLGSAAGGYALVYEPPGVWSTGQNCSACEATPQIDRTQVRDGTWHDVSYIANDPPPGPISATLTFDGTAVYAYMILTRAFSNPNGNTDLSFLIDGAPAGAFALPPNGDTTFQYNVPVYANASLVPGTHTFTMVVGQPGGMSALALLDYVVFTQEVDLDTPPSMPQQTGSAQHPSSAKTVIVLSVTLGLLALLTAAAFLWLWAKRRSRTSALGVSHAASAGKADADDEDPHSHIGHVPRLRAQPAQPDSHLPYPYTLMRQPSAPWPPFTRADSPPGSSASGFTWVPERRQYVATKANPHDPSPGLPASSMTMFTSTGVAAEGRKEKYGLPPIPQSPGDAGASSHEPSAFDSNSRDGEMANAGLYLQHHAAGAAVSFSSVADDEAGVDAAPEAQDSAEDDGPPPYAPQE